MDKTVAGVLGAVGALVAGTSAQAATAQSVLHAVSYADLLRPIANPVEKLRALDAQDVALLQEAQYYYPPPYYYYHHHHHHNRYYRPRYYHYHHHHHHHHHHNGYGRFDYD